MLAVLLQEPRHVYTLSPGIDEPAGKELCALRAEAMAIVCRPDQVSDRQRSGCGM